MVKYNVRASLNWNTEIIKEKKRKLIQTIGFVESFRIDTEIGLNRYLERIQAEKGVPRRFRICILRIYKRITNLETMSETYDVLAVFIACWSFRILLGLLYFTEHNGWAVHVKRLQSKDLRTNVKQNSTLKKRFKCCYQYFSFFSGPARI